jgi:hypothetical protein
MNLDGLLELFQKNKEQLEKDLLSMNVEKKIIDSVLEEMTFDNMKSNKRQQLFMELLDKPEHELYKKVVKPRIVPVNVLRDGEVLTDEMYVILNPKGVLQYPFKRSNGSIDPNPHPIGSVERAILDFEEEYKKNYIEIREDKFVAFTEYRADVLQFKQKIRTVYGDVRGRECLTITPKSDQKKMFEKYGYKSPNAKCLGFDAYLRHISKTDPNVRYYNPEFRSILAKMKTKDFGISE